MRRQRKPHHVAKESKAQDLEHESQIGDEELNLR